MSRNYQIMTHIVAGYPSLNESKNIARTMFSAGVDHLEIQIPFSDPLGDGETITAACQESISSGTKVADCMSLMKELKRETEIPIYFMTYFNIIFKYGIQKFFVDAKAAGCDGLIVPDIPYDEGKEDFWEMCKKNNIAFIPVISPITPENRLKDIGKMSDHMVYLVAGFGVTGNKQKVHLKAKNYVEKVKQFIHCPLALGFGVSTKEHMEEFGKYADIVVIGSHIIRLYDEDRGEKGLIKIKEFLM